ncbi:MAG: tetratricopeptide repeat protein [Elusimicrobia bacterium]|nr:tetratricopeptide repeat protein [Elusimicrobiota bacterium]
MLTSRPRDLVRRARAVSAAAAALAWGCAAPQKTRWESELAAGRKALEGRRLPEADRRLTAALRASERFPPDDPRRVETLQALAAFRFSQGELGESERLYLSAARLVESRVGDARTETAEALKLAGDVQTLRDRHAEAEATYRKALAVAERMVGADDPRLAPRLRDVALTLQALGRAREAEPLFRRALELVERARGPEHPEVAARLHDLAQLHHNEGRLAEAAPLYQRMLAIQSKTLAGDPPAQAPFLQSMALFEQARGKLDEAETLYRTTIAILEAAPGQDVRLETALEHYAHLLRARKRDREADAMERRALALRETRERGGRR